VRRPVALVVAALAGLAALAPAASDGQSSGVVVLVEGDSDGSVVSTIDTRMRITGAVTVDFHGDEASGCAASGLCGVSGTVTWDPSGPASLVAYGYRERGRRYEGGFLSIGRGNPFEPAEPATAARVRRAGEPGEPFTLCADAASALFAGVGSAPRRGSSLKLGLIADPASGIPLGDSFRTRCAGPSAADLSAALPTHVISERALRRGRGRLDFSAEGPFSAAGLTGTVHSTVVMHVGRTRDLLRGRHSSDSGGPPTHVVRRRALVVRYRIESVSGQIATGVRGLPDADRCSPLDACGMTGSVTTAPSASAGRADLSAEASLRHSRRDLERALGLAPGPSPSGVRRFGYAYWEEEHGTVTSALTRAGAMACRDSQRLNGPGVLTLRYSGGRVHARYGDADSTASDPLRTRCPGPGVSDVASSRPLAAGSFPLSTFRGRRITLELRTGAPYSADGYSGRTRPDVKVVLRRVRVLHYVQRREEPLGVFKMLARRAG
jgi:hypothetical protein